jgi:hypothetical protein
MKDATRRGFLTAAGAGTAAGLAAAALPGTAQAQEEQLPAGASGAMAAYIHDVQKSEVAVLVEGRQVIVTDKQLVARLASAFARADAAVRS